MAKRRTLRKQIESAWAAAIESDYCSQRINSERSLQASFWSQLNQLLPPVRRRLFIEPSIGISIEGRPRIIYPDFVICNRREVIAVVELKYQPRAKPSFHKDIETLRTIAEQRSGLQLVHRRFRGLDFENTAYPCATSMLFVWAGIHAVQSASYSSRDIPLFADQHPSLANSYLQLHAETHLDKPPAVFARHG